MTPWQMSFNAIPGDALPGSAPGRSNHWPDMFVRWLFGGTAEDRAAREVSGVSARFQNICISREAGAGAGLIARMIGRRLGWKVYDEELIEAIAHRMGVSLDEVRTLDELAPSVVQDWLLPLREEYYAPQEAYLDHLAKLIEAIGRAGESILVGRGANYLLPRESTLTIRVVAPMRARSIRLAERMGVSVRTARRAARDLDRRRLQFDRTMHRARSNDPHNFDLVIDSEGLGLEIAAEVIARAVEAGRPRAPGPSVRSSNPEPPALPDRPAPAEVPALPAAGPIAVATPAPKTSGPGESP